MTEGAGPRVSCKCFSLFVPSEMKQNCLVTLLDSLIQIFYCKSYLNYSTWLFSLKIVQALLRNQVHQIWCINKNLIISLYVGKLSICIDIMISNFMNCESNFYLLNITKLSKSLQRDQNLIRQENTMLSEIMYFKILPCRIQFKVNIYQN